MREIKFRAENKKTGILHNLVGFMTEYDEGDNILLYVCRSTIEATGETVEFVADTLQQYTGLEDKNGKEIYEGDVVLDIEGKNKFRNDYQVLEIGTKEGAEGRPCILPCFPLQQRCTVYDLSMETQRFKIIGNIYENPELLLNHPHRGINS